MGKIVGLMGKAGSGKDTLADYLVECHGFVKMSLADEMKRFAKKVFGFTDQQLWGPSQYRHGIDGRFNDPDQWDLAEDNIYAYGRDWCRFLFGAERETKAYYALLEWFDDIRAEYGTGWGDKPCTLSPRVVLQTSGT